MASNAVVRSWDELVEEGRRVLGNASWALGDLACEVDKSYGENKIKQFAEELGVKYEQVLQLRRVARAFPTKIVERSTISWSVAYTLAGQDDRFELIAAREWTVAEARELVRQRNELTEAKKKTLELEAASVAGLVNDLTAQLAEARASLGQAPLLTQLYQTMHEKKSAQAQANVLTWTHQRGEHDGVQVPDCPECAAKKAQEASANAPLKLYMTFPEVNSGITKLVTYVQDSAAGLSAQDKEVILASVKEMRGALDLMESLTIEGGITDEALERLMSQVKELGLNE